MFSFYCKPKKVAWKAEGFFVSWGGSKISKQWELEKNIGWRDKERLREDNRGPHCAQVILWCLCWGTDKDNASVFFLSIVLALSRGERTLVNFLHWRKGGRWGDAKWVNHLCFWPLHQSPLKQNIWGHDWGRLIVQLRSKTLGIIAFFLEALRKSLIWTMLVVCRVVTWCPMSRLGQYR